MDRDLQPLADRPFDIAIIGGGILGAGIARDATLRGLSVALVEQGDFASGTSSRSTKLVHGGLRYLEQWAFGLVAESCREREILLEMAPHLVRPLSFLLPVYDGDPRSLWKVRAGVGLYDWLTSRRRTTPRHRTLTAASAVDEEPALPREGLKGAVLFYDSQMDDARLCLETILDANRHGAVCRNCCEVSGFRQQGDRLAAAEVVDRVSGEAFDVRATLFINAAGPWVERVAQLADADPDQIALSPTKGVHLLIPRINREHGVYFQAAQQRMVFLLPWGDLSMLGTTDTDYRDDPAQVSPDDDDVAYLLEQLHGVMPEANVAPTDVITSFAGVRALLRAQGNRPSARSREERIQPQGANLLSVAGGKYTTFRAIADRVVRQAAAMIDRRVPPCSTDSQPLEDRRPTRTGVQLSDSPLVHESDVRYACSDELAVTMEDIMRRRTGLALSRYGGEETAEAIAQIAASQLNWTDATRQAQLDDYLTSTPFVSGR